MKFIKFIVCLVVAFAIGTASFGAGAGVAFAALSLIPTGAPAGSLRSGLIPEVWTKEFVKRFNHIDRLFAIRAARKYHSSDRLRMRP